MRLRTIFAFALLVVCACAAPGAAAATGQFASGCPQEAPEEGTVGSFNQDPAAKNAMVPRGATSVRVCRYWGFSNAAGRQTPKSQARVGKLREEGTGSGSDLVESVTLEFEELAFVKRGTYNCPFDEGAKLYAAFSYPSAEPVVVEVKLSGCEFVNNGRAPTRDATESLIKRLARIAEGRPGTGKAPHAVEGKRAVDYPPPHLSFALATREAKELIEGACRESELCPSGEAGECKRRSARTFTCRYTVKLTSGDVCRGPITITRLGGEGPISISPGTQSTKEGECFYLFVPPEVREIEEREEERESKPHRPSGGGG